MLAPFPSFFSNPNTTLLEERRLAAALEHDYGTALYTTCEAVLSTDDLKFQDVSMNWYETWFNYPWNCLTYHFQLGRDVTPHERLFRDRFVYWEPVKKGCQPQVCIAAGTKRTDVCENNEEKTCSPMDIYEFFDWAQGPIVIASNVLFNQILPVFHANADVATTFPTLLQLSHWTKTCREILAKCLAKDARYRQNATTIFEHSWVYNARSKRKMIMDLLSNMKTNVQEVL
ncbi:hypothetical protein L3Y34_011458 [Caenorhabditis briggsae]|uniref:Uncharacterized protein n=1 Tax=Caenorhabditis briggsae TaxID=6238 RepID=A0AAE8ZLP8_CAEBR|nr:hypothetical protein L3Y34_011458 [Caenorhabditis briggsae]